MAPGQDPLPADLAEGLKVGAGGERAVLEVPLTSLVPVLPPQLQLRQGLRVPRLWERRGRGGHHASPSRSLYEALSAARAAPHTLRTGMVLIRSPRTRHMPAEVGLLSASLESICRASALQHQGGHLGGHQEYTIQAEAQQPVPPARSGFLVPEKRGGSSLRGNLFHPTF